MSRDMRAALLTISAALPIAVSLLGLFAYFQLPISTFHLFLYISVPTVLFAAIFHPRWGFLLLLLFIGLSPTEWADGVPILSYDYPYLKPGVNLYDGLLLVVTIIHLGRSRSPWLGYKSLFLIFSFYGMFTAVSVLLSAFSHSSLAVYSLYILLDLLRMLLIIVNLLSFRMKDYERANLIFMFTSFILVLYMFSGQAIANVEGRLSTLGLGPNGVGGFCPLLIPLAATYLKNKNPLLKIAGLACFVLLWVGLLLSQSRSGLVGAAVGSALAFYLIADNKKRFLIATVPALLIGLAILPNLTLLDRFSTNSDNGRLDLWKYSIKYMMDHINYLFFGLGPGMYYQFALEYLGIHIGFSPEHAHNLFITRIMENGILVMTLELLLVLAPIYLLLRKIPKLPHWLHGYWLGIVAYYIHSLADYTLWLHKISFFFWFFVFANWLIYRHLQAEHRSELKL